jgi:hypothetical protein
LKVLFKMRLPLAVLGVLFFYYAQRYMDGMSTYSAAWSAGTLMLIASLALDLFKSRTAPLPQEQSSAIYPALWKLSVLIGFACYGFYIKSMGTAADPSTFVQKALLAAWLCFVILGLIAGSGIEWSYVKYGTGRFAEPKRVARTGGLWLCVGFLLAGITGLNYVAVKRDRSWDWSYLKTAQVSESTKKLLQAVDKELEIGVFFNSTNEVLSQVRGYFDGLKGVGGSIKIDFYDAEINPQAAEKFKAVRNGQVIIKYQDATEKLDIGTTLSNARKTLRNLDAEFQKALLAATQKKKNIYFTQGHGELNWNGSSEDALRSIKLLEGFLRSQNYTLKYLSITEGAGQKIPQDADAVAIVGPTTPFVESEVSGLKTYLEGGGSALVMVDLDAPNQEVLSKVSRDFSTDPLLKYMESMGLKYQPVPLANNVNFVAGSKTEADVWFLFSNGFSSHESISSLARFDQKAALLTFRSGYFTMTPELGGWQNIETVRSLADTFADENKDFKFQEGKEKKNTYIQGVASQKKGAPGADGKTGKLIALSDASAASDLLIRNQGNLIYFVESLRWLAGSPAAQGSGVASSEEDVRIRHTKREDTIWFYGTVALMPALVLGLGFIATRRAKRTRKQVG